MMAHHLFLVSLLFSILTFTFAIPSHRGNQNLTRVSGLGVPVSNAQASNIISNRYIVVYNNNATDEMVEMHQASVMTALRKRNINTRGLDGRTLSPVMEAFSMSGWRGMSLEAEDKMMIEIAACTDVAYVEADTIVKTNALVQQSAAPAGLKRISHAAAGTGTAYVFDNSSSAGIVAYVVDTGIRTTHSVCWSTHRFVDMTNSYKEFAGRATFGANFVNTNACFHLIFVSEIADMTAEHGREWSWLSRRWYHRWKHLWSRKVRLSRCCESLGCNRSRDKLGCHQWLELRYETSRLP